MAEQLNQGTIMKMLDWSYDQVIFGGIPGTDSAYELANSYNNTPESVDKLIKNQSSKTAATGFMAGIGGITTMTVAIPADLLATTLVHMRMVAAIAILSGKDPKTDDTVRTCAYLCLCGDDASKVVKNIAIQAGQKMTYNIIKTHVTGKALTRINQAVGFRLLTKFGQTGVINLGKAVPLAGGIIGGAFNFFVTKKIGNVAKNTFLNVAVKELEQH